MWQALLEEGVLTHGKSGERGGKPLQLTYFTAVNTLFNYLLLAVNKEQPFKDKCFLYRFRLDEEGGAPAAGIPQADDLSAANEHIREALSALFQRGPDATLRMILRKP